MTIGRRFIPALLLIASTPAAAGIVPYEGELFPDDIGWVRSQRLYLADRWIEDGWFVQQAEVAIPGIPPNVPEVDEDDYYRRSISEFSETQAFFLEWRMATDGGREGIASVAPAVIVAGGILGVNYHFTIADDQVRLIRDNRLPLLFVDIAPGVPHTYHLELYGTELYVWWIDGQVVDSGIPEGQYPTPDSEIVFGARAAGETITARWDYIRYGLIPQDGSGDYDSDAAITEDDFYFFHECLTNDRPGIHGGPENDAGPGCRFADFDSDGDADLLDFAEFQNAFGRLP